MGKRNKLKPQRHALIAKSMDFASFIMGQESLAGKIDRIILFGSVARADYGAESDIDLFIDAEENVEKQVEKQIEVWEASKRAEDWNILGVENSISLKVGRLEKWPTLQRAIISDGIQLYGKYIAAPKGLKHYFILSLKYPSANNKYKVVLSRKLFGYSQKVGKKIYRSQGLVAELGGLHIGRGAVILPAQSLPKLSSFLRKHKIEFSAKEAWSD